MRGGVMMAILLLGGVAAKADDSVIALSPAQRAAAIEGAAGRDEALPLNGNPRQVHGEVGMEVGSGGHRAVWGSTVIPLGETGSAAFSFLTAQGRGWRR